MVRRRAAAPDILWGRTIAKRDSCSGGSGIVCLCGDSEQSHQHEMTRTAPSDMCISESSPKSIVAYNIKNQSIPRPSLIMDAYLGRNFRMYLKSISAKQRVRQWDLGKVHLCNDPSNVTSAWDDLNGTTRQLYFRVFTQVKHRLRCQEPIYPTTKFGNGRLPL